MSALAFIQGRYHIHLIFRTLPWQSRFLRRQVHDNHVSSEAQRHHFDTKTPDLCLCSCRSLATLATRSPNMPLANGYCSASHSPRNGELLKHRQKVDFRGAQDCILASGPKCTPCLYMPYPVTRTYPIGAYGMYSVIVTNQALCTRTVHILTTTALQDLGDPSPDLQSWSRRTTQDFLHMQQSDTQPSSYAVEHVCRNVLYPG